MKNLHWPEAVIIAVGIALLGLFIYLGFGTFAARDRAISVRGLAEREVSADHVTWPIKHRISSNDVQALYSQINTANEHIRRFLIDNGIPAADIFTSAPDITDRKTRNYSSEELQKYDRYTGASVVTVSTKLVDKARALMPRMGELLKNGIVIESEDYDTNISYAFNGLNGIKPAMIEEATKKAREAGEKFATDSGSKLGKIKNATQGLFSIEDRDGYTPYIKRVRVVTSIDYYLDE